MRYGFEGRPLGRERGFVWEVRPDRVEDELEQMRQAFVPGGVSFGLWIGAVSEVEYRAGRARVIPEG